MRWEYRHVLGPAARTYLTRSIIQPGAWFRARAVPEVPGPWSPGSIRPLTRRPQEWGALVVDFQRLRAGDLPGVLAHLVPREQMHELADVARWQPRWLWTV